MARLLVSSPQLAERLQRAGHSVSWDPSGPVNAELLLIGFEDGPISGPEWVRLQRNRARSTPLLVVCANTEQAEQALAAGADDVVRTPLSPAVMAARLRGWLAAPSPSLSDAAGASDLLPRLVEASPDPVVAVDLQGQILLFSRAAEEVLGYPADLVLGRMHVGQLYAAAGDASDVLARLKAAEGHRINGHVVRLRSAGGESIMVQLSAALLHDALGRPVATVGIFRDDRERLQLARALESTTDQLVQSEARGSLLDAARAGLAELADPLTEALGRLELACLSPEVDPGMRVQLSQATGPLDRVLQRTRELTERLDTGT
ncbi:MAG: PAS domain S-box-containing protein [Cognaticolwellia sp.]|jgi:PAS domain S-box-containing protein